MTRTTTIAGGLEGVGRTQLALNLALELVRRGRFAGVFSDTAAAADLGEVLNLPVPAGIPQRRADDGPPAEVDCRGYQGMDLLGCSVGLDDWPACEAERLERCIRALDSREGYDELLVDTSGMSAQAVLACCLAADTVLLMVTPDQHSQAQAFALLRILQLNGFGGEPGLVVNRASSAVDGQDVRQAFSVQTRVHLGLELPLLGTLIEDTHVAAARRFRQAFTTVYPEAELSGCIVALADSYEDLVPPAAGGRSLANFWGRVRELLAGEMRLPGMQPPVPVRAGRSGSA